MLLDNPSVEVTLSQAVISPRLQQAIGYAARRAYTKLGGETFGTQPVALRGSSKAKMVWQLPLCADISAGMIAALSTDHQARVEYHPGWNVPGVDKLILHAYVVFGADNNADTIIADASWQQMWERQRRLGGSVLPELPTDAPHVLVGTRAQVVEQARSYGITDPRILALWDRPGEPRSTLIELAATF